MTALLTMQDARIDVDGAALLDGLTFSAADIRVGLVGAWGPLFQLLAGEARLAAGGVRVHDHDAASAVREGVVGVALCDPALPHDWSAHTYLYQSARLTGLGRSAARGAARDALEKLGMQHLSGTALGRLRAVERRALLVAHASLGDPPVLAVESPLEALDTDSQGWLSQVLQRASSGRRLIVSVAHAPALGPERNLLDRMDEVLVLEANSLVAQGPPGHALSHGPRYLVSVARHGRALAEALSEQELRVDIAQQAGSSEPLGQAPVADAARLIVHLPEGAPPDAILDAALALNAPLLELVPLARSTQ